jgi:outer membrane protein assembly factor BamA
VGELFDLDQAKRLRLRFYESGLYTDVTMLFYRNDDGVHVQYYFKEDRRPFVYSASPYLSIKNHVGVRSDVIARNLFESTHIGIGFTYSEDDYNIRFVASDRYWRERLGFKMLIEWFNEDYLFSDLASASRYERQGTRSNLEFRYRFASEQSVAIIINNERSKHSSAAFGSETFDIIALGFEYERNKTDWPLFPLRGHYLRTQFWYTNIQDVDRFRSSELLAKYYQPITAGLNGEFVTVVRHNHDDAPHFLGYHLEQNVASSGLYSSHFFASSLAIASARLRILGTIEYDPFFLNEFMIGGSIYAAGGRYQNVNFNDYWQLGVTIHTFWKKNKIDISLSRDIFDTVFLQLSTEI